MAAVWLRVTVVAICLLPATGRAQNHTSHRTSRSGVFTPEQAASGQAVFATFCRSCHTPGVHAPGFRSVWQGRPLSELFDYIRDNMPKDNPGALTSGEYLVALAYLLRSMGMPPGNSPLPEDIADLRMIRLDTLPPAGESKP